ncbi:MULTISPECIES: hypothetical protein [Bizionia]|uniref:Gliding motility lipoprotein GldD n=1 Tax=Bizionia algoritergicola TaxID=291187 RepID=A0A5D0R000_9FLAO|nr:MULTISPECIES: hypothetical protein [Bizionia]TYB74862.1 hypothetical protein ES675_01620 [Bizionia algoritergicola]
MKIKNPVLVIVMLIVVIGCGSTKKKPKQFVCLDTSKVKALLENYELTIPETWCSFYGLHNTLVHSPINVKQLEENYNTCYVYVDAYDIENYKSKNIEETLDTYISALKEKGNYNPDYEFENHPIYGKYYLIKYGKMYNDVTYYNLKALFNYQNQDYVINYTATEQNFNRYLPKVIQMIVTFKIKESIINPE